MVKFLYFLFINLSTYKNCDKKLNCLDSRLSNNNNTNIDNKLSGFDSRFINNDTNIDDIHDIDKKLLANISSYIKNKKLIEKLESNLDITSKIKIAEDLLNDKTIYTPNISAGGLFNDWDF